MTYFDDLNDWQYEVENGDTVLGFAEWLEHKKESEVSDREVLQQPKSI
jgi:hypothetical protein